MALKVITGARYSLIITDYATQVVWFRTLKTKNQIVNKFVKWLKMITNLGKTVKRVLIDDESEYKKATKYTENEEII